MIFIHFHMKLFLCHAQGVNKMQMQFHFQDGRPKQKRHRCRNPNKIDVNSLTGEERVQIINRRNARKVCMCGISQGFKYYLKKYLNEAIISSNYANNGQ